MESVRSWITPILIRALDENLEITESKSLRVEDDLSNFYIHCDAVELVQLVEVRTSPACLSISWGKLALHAFFTFNTLDDGLRKCLILLTRHSGSLQRPTSRLLLPTPKPLSAQSLHEPHLASVRKALGHPPCLTLNPAQSSACVILSSVSQTASTRPESRFGSRISVSIIKALSASNRNSWPKSVLCRTSRIG